MARRRSKGSALPLPVLGVLLAFCFLIYLYDGMAARNTPGDVSGTVAVHFIDVGQGDSILITTESGAMLIDTGENEYAQTVIDYIRAQGVAKLDYAVATHPHADHMGGMAKIIDAIPIETFLAPDVTHTTNAFEKMLDALEARGLGITTPAVGTRYTMGEAVFTILAPANPKENDLNNASLVIRMDYGGTSFLFTGDAESASEAEMLASGRALDCDVLKVGHHGSDTSSSKAFLSSVSPGIAVISCGVGNSYGHPHAEAVKRLQNIDASILRTDLEGTIVLVTDGVNITQR